MGSTSPREYTPTIDGQWERRRAHDVCDSRGRFGRRCHDVVGSQGESSQSQ